MDPAFVETVPGRGYRFIAPVEVVGKSPEAERAPSQPLAVTTAPQIPAVSKVKVRRRGPLLVAVIGVVLLAGVALWPRLVPGASSPSITLAVLPFVNIGHDPERQYLADGLTEETSASLAQVDPAHLSVKGRTLRYKGTTKSAAEIGQELSVDYLLEGSIQSEAGQLRVTTKLIRVRDQEYVWTQSYERAPSSVLGLQREMSAAIASQIRLRLSPEQLDSVTRRQPRSAEAYDLYLRGRNFANQRTPATTSGRSNTTSEQSPSIRTTRSPGQGLPDTLASGPINGDAQPVAVADRAREAALQAVRANPEQAEAQFALAYIRWQVDWDWPAAEKGLRTAIALSIRDTQWRMSFSDTCSRKSGRQAEARAMSQRARELDPLDPLMSRDVVADCVSGWRLRRRRSSSAQGAISLDPEFWIGHIMSGQALLQMGQSDQAIEA